MRVVAALLLAVLAGACIPEARAQDLGDDTMLNGAMGLCAVGDGFIRPTGALCPAQWPTDSFPASCPSLPGTPSHVWEARRESMTDGDAVATMTDFGAVGTNLVQATSTAKPTYHASGGPGDQPYFSFDGGDSVKSAAEGTSLAQPNLIAIVAEANTTAAEILLDSFDSSPRTLVWETSVNSSWRVQTSATALPANTTVINGRWELITATTNGASSELRVSGPAYATGDAGSAAFAAGTMGCNISAANCLNGGIALAVVYDTPPDIPTLEAAIESCYGALPQ